MSIKNLDSDILELEKKYENLGYKLENILGEIEDLESEQNDIEYDMGEIEKQITVAKKEMLAGIETFNIETDDVFTNDFMKASYFTARYDEGRPILQTVCIKENELWGLDGYRAIIITNNQIPKDLQNSYINWNIRENFEENILDENMKFVDLRSIMPKKENAKYVIQGLTNENFNRVFKIEEMPCDIDDAGRLYYKDFICGINREFLNDALMALKGKVFTMYIETKVSPILIEAENMEILLLPIRIK